MEELSRQPLLVKIGADFDSSNFDEIEYRRKIYIEANGGTTEEICAWKECEKFAINGMRICVEHAYPRET